MHDALCTTKPNAARVVRKTNGDVGMTLVAQRAFLPAATRYFSITVLWVLALRATNGTPLPQPNNNDHSMPMIEERICDRSMAQ